MDNQTSKSGKKGFLILLTSFLILLGVFVIFLLRKKKTTAVTAPSNIEPEHKEFSTSLLTELVDNGFSAIEAQYWTCVSAHETAGWTSDVYNNNNNCFGMKQPNERPTVSKGEMNGYASYSDDKASVRDLRMWCDYVSFGSEHASLRTFVSEMNSKKYFTDSYLNYVNDCLKWQKLLFN